MSVRTSSVQKILARRLVDPWSVKDHFYGENALPSELAVPLDCCIYRVEFFVFMFLFFVCLV